MRPTNTFELTIVRPGGNDTCLIRGIIRDLSRRTAINKAITSMYPNVEQVGFVDLSIKSTELLMAGDEFCGNATRSTAWLALGGKPGSLEITVSGVTNTLQAGVNTNGEAFAQMPIYPDVSRISSDPDFPGNKIVQIEGITHYINFNTDEIDGLSPELIRAKARELIFSKKLNRYPAAGVIYSKKNGDLWSIVPVVYVKNNEQTYLETACGSGTIALGMALSNLQKSSIDISVIQPTGLAIRAEISFDGRTYSYAQISGPIQTIQPFSLQQLPIEETP